MDFRDQQRPSPGTVADLISAGPRIPDESNRYTISVVPDSGGPTRVLLLFQSNRTISSPTAQWSLGHRGVVRGGGGKLFN